MVETRSGAPLSARAHEPVEGVFERRGEPRYPAGSIGFRSSEIQASLVDLSPGGLGIESLEHPPIGCTVAFVLQQGRARVGAEAQVCWCKLKRTYRTAEGDVVAVYRAGLELGRDRPGLLASIVRSARLEWGGGHA